MAAPQTFVAKCDVGLGLFAADEIAEGVEILHFSGAELTLPQVRAKQDRACDALQIGVNRYLDLAEPGRFVNHSCNPNAGVRNDCQLVSLRRISRNEEIRFDYSTTIGDGWTMPCCCDFAGCRRLIAAYRLLPDAIRNKYAVLELVQKFLVDQWGA